MAFGGYLGTTGIKGPWDVVGLRRQHNAWLGAHERMILDQANQLGDMAISQAQNQRKVKRSAPILHFLVPLFISTSQLLPTIRSVVSPCRASLVGTLTRCFDRLLAFQT